MSRLKGICPLSPALLPAPCALAPLKAPSGLLEPLPSEGLFCDCPLPRADLRRQVEV